MSQRRKWTQEVVEFMWTELEAQQHLRADTKANEWWSLIADAIHTRFGFHVTAKACMTKACEVHHANRPYPWDDASRAVRRTPPTEVPLAAVIVALSRIAKQVAALGERIDGLIATTPEAKPAVNQLWVSRARRIEAHNEHCYMRVSNLDDHEVTLEEVGGGRWSYTLPRRNLVQHFSHVGFAQPPRRNALVQLTPEVAAASATPTIVSKEVTPAPTPKPAPNGRKDLADILT